jgi:transcriptional regulator of acetoin/glycerol metabolism
MLCFAWPGNIRQLRNVLRFALAVSDGQTITAADLPQELNEQVGPGTAMLPPPVPAVASGGEDCEAAPLLDALVRHKWSVTKVSEELNLARATVYRYMKKYGIVPPNQR